MHGHGWEVGLVCYFQILLRACRTFPWRSTATSFIPASTPAIEQLARRPFSFFPPASKERARTQSFTALAQTMSGAIVATPRKRHTENGRLTVQPSTLAGA
jgi:hypothetical protein